MSPLKISITKEGQLIEQTILTRGQRYQQDVEGVVLIAEPDNSSIPGLDADAWSTYCTDAAIPWEKKGLEQQSIHKAYINDIHPRGIFSFDTVFEFEANWIPENE